jgi:ApaG protein
MAATATTHGIRVDVTSEFIPERSSAARRAFFFTYVVRIANVGEDVVQLVSRHWHIENGRGQREEVEGPGVVGETPVLAPGEAFEYRSFCPLDTEFGAMHGTYRMRTLQGGGAPEFDVEIPRFLLAAPTALN